MEVKPKQHIFNVGNPECISVKNWADACYQVAQREFKGRNIYTDIDQRCYFPFYRYEYCLDVSRQADLMDNTTALESGLQESYDWYLENRAWWEEIIDGEYVNYYEKMYKHAIKYRASHNFDVHIRR